MPAGEGCERARIIRFTERRKIVSSQIPAVTESDIQNVSSIPPCGSMDTLRPRAAVRKSQPNIERRITATIQNPTAIPISRSTWRPECQCSPRTMRADAPLRRHAHHYQNEQEPFIQKRDYI